MTARGNRAVHATRCFSRRAWTRFGRLAPRWTCSSYPSIGGRRNEPSPFETSGRGVGGGADVVIGHHAHVLQPVEKVGDALVFYGLGNLVFDRSGPAGAVAR